MELLGIQLWKWKRMNLNVFGLKRDPTSGSTCWWWLVRWVRNSMIYSSSNILHKYMKLLTCEFVVFFRCYQLILSIDTQLANEKKKLQLLFDGLIRFFYPFKSEIFLWTYWYQIWYVIISREWQFKLIHVVLVCKIILFSL